MVFSRPIIPRRGVRREAPASQPRREARVLKKGQQARDPQDHQGADVARAERPTGAAEPHSNGEG